LSAERTSRMRFNTEDARVHCAVLKIRTEPQRTKPPIREAVRPGRSRKRALQRLLPQDPTACSPKPGTPCARSATPPKREAY